ncbi:unnamed protein product [Leptidea sinapis]|uniref:Uncharacterized protein n=1 Tax=Leptidea sinapis TaxID=189913 RepID=A0A5E4Q265_9NEOP|nr:unnamed protein product [Leptidea sinapis]
MQLLINNSHPITSNMFTATCERTMTIGHLARKLCHANSLWTCFSTPRSNRHCSTEKGALHCGVATRLRMRARKLGWRVHVSDLHWRSPLEQQRDHRVSHLKLTRQSELGAVVPVLFLSSNLGTPLLPHTLECADFKAALQDATDENDKALLNKW